MITYCAHGERTYGQKPVSIHHRAAWEFEAALVGRCSPLLRAGPIPARSRTLWLFPPQLAHGWTGEGSQPCEVVVFHASHVPELLDRCAQARLHQGEPLAVDLDDAEVVRLRLLADELRRGRLEGDPLFALREERTVLELALMVLARLPSPPRPSPSAEATVRAALAWHAEHLADGCGEEAVAEAVAVSPAHLRRLFHRVLGVSPRAAFARARLRRAEDLIALGDLRLDQVAAACGFASGAAFSRAFARLRGVPPSHARRTTARPPAEP